MAAKKRRRRKSGRKYAFRRILLLIVILGLIIWGGIALVKLGIKAAGKLIAPAPTPTPIPEETPMPAPEPTELPAGIVPRQMEPAAFSSAGFSSEIVLGREAVTEFNREVPIYFGNDRDFTELMGITTYGGNNYRNTFTYGTQYITQQRLNRVWEKEIGTLNSEQNGSWSGTGWTGMPIIIQWPEDVRPILGIYEQFKAKQGFTEVIYPAMDGYIYFLELSTGLPTRDPLHLGVVTKGTATLDPRGYPLLYTGQGIPATKETTFGSWVRVISLIDNSIIWDFGGTDPYALRQWQAYDGSPLVDGKTDTLIIAGESGVLYSVKLNSGFDKAAGTVSVAPDKLQKYRYRATGYGDSDNKRWYGMESSVAAFKNYLFMTDNGGMLQCVDVNTLQPVYIKDITDDCDGGVVIEESPKDGTIYLYTANEIEKQPTTDGMGKCVHRKINGITGDTVWEREWEAALGNSSGNGGTITTPHVGRGNIANLVIFNQSLVPVSLDGETKQGGRIIAYNKTTGNEEWRYEQEAGYWSNPVVIYDEKGCGYLIQGDRNGILRLHDAKTGAVLTEVNLGSRIESTPAVFNNMLVVGTRGQYGSGESAKIIGVGIK